MNIIDTAIQDGGNAALNHCGDIMGAALSPPLTTNNAEDILASIPKVEI